MHGFVLRFVPLHMLRSRLLYRYYLSKFAVTLVCVYFWLQVFVSIAEAQTSAVSGIPGNQIVSSGSSTGVSQSVPSTPSSALNSITNTTGSLSQSLSRQGRATIQSQRGSPLRGSQADDSFIRQGRASGILAENSDVEQGDINAEALPSTIENNALSAFQAYVKDSTGWNLPIFGMKFFATPASYAQINHVPVPQDYLLGPGDELVISITGMLESYLRLIVDRNGQINIPKLGPIPVHGVLASRAEEHIYKALSRYYKDFQITVSLGRLRTIDIYVVGEAARPGKWTVSALSSLVNAVFAAGGPSAAGSMRAIQLRRADKTVTRLDLYRFLQAGDKSTDQRLLPGDIIVFPPAGPRVALVGGIDQAGIYELGSTERSLEALLNLASPPRALVNPDKVLIERIGLDKYSKAREVIELSLNPDDQKTSLQDGDIITLFSNTQRFGNAVTLRGNVASPLRYAFRSGMTLLDLIPNKEALMDANYFTRTNRMVQYVGAAKEKGEPRARLDEPYWEYAIIERLRSDNLQTLTIPFNLGRLVLDNDLNENHALEAGDVVTIFSKSEFRLPKGMRQSLVRIEGEVNRPGTYSIELGDTLTSIVEKAGGLTKLAHPYSTIFTRESVREEQEKLISKIRQELQARIAELNARLAQNSDSSVANQLRGQIEYAREFENRYMLAKPSGRIALKIDPNELSLPPYIVENGDRIIVSSKSEVVFVSGAVDTDSAFSYQEGRKVSDYLSLAGISHDAEMSEIFIARSNGSIIKKNDGLLLGFRASPIQNETIYPGDSIIVPKKFDKESFFTLFMRSAKDFATVFGQLGVGAAAVKVLRQ